MERRSFYLFVGKLISQKQLSLLLEIKLEVFIRNLLLFLSCLNPFFLLSTSLSILLSPLSLTALLVREKMHLGPASVCLAPLEAICLGVLSSSLSLSSPSHRVFSFIFLYFLSHWVSSLILFPCIPPS